MKTERASTMLHFLKHSSSSLTNFQTARQSTLEAALEGFRRQACSTEPFALVRSGKPSPRPPAMAFGLSLPVPAQRPTPRSHASCGSQASAVCRRLCRNSAAAWGRASASLNRSNNHCARGDPLNIGFGRPCLPPLQRASRIRPGLVGTLDRIDPKPSRVEDEPPQRQNLRPNSKGTEAPAILGRIPYKRMSPSRSTVTRRPKGGHATCWCSLLVEHRGLDRLFRRPDAIAKRCEHRGALRHRGRIGT
jgi:hypothetical protein